MEHFNLISVIFLQPDLSGALFVSQGKSIGTKKRERRAEIAAQIIFLSFLRSSEIRIINQFNRFGNLFINIFYFIGLDEDASLLSVC